MELQDVEVRAEGLGFPEGPVAMADGSVIVCEISRGRLSRVGTDGEVTVVADVGGGPNGAAVGPDGALYVCNNGGLGRRRPARRRSSASILMAARSTSCIPNGKGGPSPPPTTWSSMRRVDSGSPTWEADAIYYARPDGTSVERALRGLRAPNGIGLSPEGDVLYWAETMTRQVHRRRLSEPGQIVPAVPYSVGSLLGGDHAGPLDSPGGVAGRPGTGFAGRRLQRRRCAWGHCWRAG